MVKYAALLRGIAPTNPNMHNIKLRKVFMDLGYKNVQTIISSGNVIFEANKTSGVLEKEIEEALPKQLGFKSTTIIRSLDQLEELIAKSPFGKLVEGPKSRLNVTFLKTAKESALKFPYNNPTGMYVLLGDFGQAICSSTDLSQGGTPDVMSFLEKQFGKEITTRTWKSVNRIVKRMAESD